ncbi:acyl-homoserine-lactone synthase [Methyloferula stellata]|uniref:acyl-homoserine-lactone synthase n=1 Tax=Methyloferula stellata TaxID=876270 RepID=UPI0003739B1F|nr:acyl-homoserine-lactone synthase [Methyloferula stellata]
MEAMVIYGHEHGKYSAYFDQIFRLRYEVFVRGRGWSLPSRGGLEVDQYDTDEAVYFITLRDDGSIEGSVRATPTAHSSLLADYFPHLVENGVSPRGPGIFETTRFIVQPTRRTRETVRKAKARLLAPLLEWCLEKGLVHFQTVIDASALASYVEITPHTRILGLAHPFGGGRGVPGGGECMALRWPVSTDVLDDINLYGSSDYAKFDPAVSATALSMH